MEDVERKRAPVRTVTPRNGVIAGSVWETRMKTDDFKLFNGENSIPSTTPPLTTTTPTTTEEQDKKLKPRQGDGTGSPGGGGGGGGGKRKTWKSDISPAERNPIQIAKQDKAKTPPASPIIHSSSRSEPRKTPIPNRARTRSLSLSLSPSPSQTDSSEYSLNESNPAVDDGGIVPLRKSKSETSSLESDQSNEVIAPIEIEIDNSADEVGKAVMLAGNGTGKLISDEEDVIKEMNVEEADTQNSPLDKRILQRNEKPVPISSTISTTIDLKKKQQMPTITPQSKTFKPTPVAGVVPKTHSKLQSFIDLVMWRDVSKSALVFGMGTFTIISSSYTRDLNISFISVISYMGLVYLVAIFIFRSIISRGGGGIERNERDGYEEEHVVGEEEAIWLLKLILPYINEFLFKVRALFSGDPATTMKLAVLLFVLARCGSSITIWKMAKLGFFGVFTVPKICSSYSSQLTAYGTFWIHRFMDAWESCSHKKAVAFGVFTLVWNLSSIVARIWAVFMLFAAFRYYQMSMVKEEWVEEEAETIPTKSTATTTTKATSTPVRNIWQDQRQGLRPASVDFTYKQKKKS